MEMAKVIEILNKQEAELKRILQAQVDNADSIEKMYTAESLDIQQLEGHRLFGIKLINDENNQKRAIENTKIFLQRKRKEVNEAYKKVEVLKKLKENQEKQYYKEVLDAEMKETDDITSARFNIA
jgi:flagellar export protein FliJ